MNTPDLRHKITLGRPHPNGGRYLTQSRAEKARVMTALKDALAGLRKAGKHTDANAVQRVIIREFGQERPPFVGYLTHAEWQAVSRGLRLDSVHDRSVYSLLVHRKEYWHEPRAV